MKTLKGNIFDYMDQGYFDVIIQGTNCFCTQGAGLAKQFKEKYPEVLKIDQTTKKGDRSKLGGYTYTNITTPTNHRISVINAYTQYHYGKGLKADYDAIISVFNLISQNFSKESRIGYPMISSGHAGGDWQIISKIIDEELEGFEHTVVVYKT